MAQDFTAMAQSVLGFFFAGVGDVDEHPLMLNAAPQVALELLKIIADRESKQRIEKPNARTYYLTLYRQCLKAVSGNSLAEVLAES